MEKSYVYLKDMVESMLLADLPVEVYERLDDDEFEMMEATFVEFGQTYLLVENFATITADFYEGIKISLQIVQLVPNEFIVLHHSFTGLHIVKESDAKSALQHVANFAREMESIDDENKEVMNELIANLL